jgi:hypothetical protein
MECDHDEAITTIAPGPLAVPTGEKVFAADPSSHGPKRGKNGDINQVLTEPAVK